MQGALRAAAELRAASDTEAARRETELTARETALHRVLALLDEAQPGWKHHRSFGEKRL